MLKVLFVRFPNRARLLDKLFVRLAKNLLENGSFVKKNAMYALKASPEEEHAVGVLARVEVVQDTSIRDIATEADISSAQRILKKYKLHPYKIHLHQGLFPGYYERRLHFIV